MTLGWRIGRTNLTDSFSMSLSSIQRFTVSLSQRVRRACKLLGDKLHGSSQLHAWFYPPEKAETADESYRKWNEDYFADLHSQERMLADQERMAFYHEAINRKIQPGDRVIDLGTGTGILAAFASRAGAGQVLSLIHISEPTRPY